MSGRRTPDGMFARLQRVNLAQGFAELAEELADRITPIMRRQPGFRSLTLLSDETSGEYLYLSHWDSLEQINEGYADMNAGKNIRGVLVYE